MPFPTTSVLDTFNRADANLNGDGSWLAPMLSGDSGLAVVSNQCGQAGGGFASAYWSAATFGPDVEVFTTVPTVPANGSAIELWGRVSGGGGGSASGYFVDVTKAAGTDTWSIWKSVSGTQTQIGASVSQELGAGDSIGLEIIGTTVKAYIKTGGVWTQVLSRTDSAITGAGNIGLVIQNAVARADDFGGGAVAASGQPAARRTGGIKHAAGRAGMPAGVNVW